MACHTIDSAVLRNLYSTPAMRDIWQDSAIIQNWLDTEAENAGAKIDRIRPRERHDAAEQNQTAGFWFREAVAVSSCFVEHRRDVHSGAYARVRRAVLAEGRSEREVAREFGLARETVRKMLRHSLPPGYRRKEPAKRPKLGPWLGVIDAILEEDKQRPAKQRHTAKRIFDRLRAEYGFTGGHTTVKDYVRLHQQRRQEMFVPLTHAPGTAQADFGEALVVMAGVELKAHYLAMDLPHSDDIFVMAFPCETTEAFLEGHVQAFAYWGGVPISILYDNTKIAVSKILGDGERQRTRAFSELQSHYLFADKFGRPGKGNDKGNVEGLVGYVRRNFLVPVPRTNSWEELNAYLREQCLQHRQHRVRGEPETIGERFERDRAALLPLPPVPTRPARSGQHE